MTVIRPNSELNIREGFEHLAIMLNGSLFSHVPLARRMVSL
jgi:hypothetical protein